tara:strand:+ start:76 stop:1515 length:1440 start_codon:yes stop_codon:yes gene_type:complete
MAISHRTNRLKLIGTPAVEQLQNGRYQLTVNCTTMNSREDWYSSNKARIFPDFGSLESAEMSIDGLAPRTGEAYTDMRLVSVQSSTQQDKYIVTLVYQTLGASFVQVKDDTIILQENGLRTVTRKSIAKAGTDIPTDDKDIGVDYIDHQIDAETAVRCFLSSYKVDDTDSYREFERTYIQAGTLSISESNESEGVVKVITTFLVTEGTTVGPVIARSTGEFAGLKTISVTTLQDSAGQSIVHGGENTVNQYNRMVDFTYPGVLSIDGDKIIDGSYETTLYNFDLTPPVQAKIQSRVSVIFQTSADIAASDFTFDDGDAGGAATELWNPTEWASTYVSGVAFNYSPFSETKGLRGYRINTTMDGVVPVDTAAGLISYSHLGVNVITLKRELFLETVIDTSAGSRSAVINGIGANVSSALTIANGKKIFASTPFRMEISGGPIDPVGVKFTLDVDLRPAFSDIDGNTYYKKTIITSTVPDQ